METIETINKRKENSIKQNVSGLCNTISAFIFLFLMLYFIIMRAIGLHELFALRDFNAVFLLGGILLALFSYNKKNKIEYITGLEIGIRITMSAVIPFALFIYFYLMTDNGFMDLLKIKLSLGEFTGIVGENITPAIAAAIICIEGLLSGAIITFLAMQYLKNK